MPSDEIDNIVSDNIGAVGTIGVVLLLTVDLESRIRVATRPTIQLPETMFIKTKSIWRLHTPLKLPLTRNTSCVPCLAQQMPKGCRLGIEDPKSNIVPFVIDSRHDLNTRRRTNRLGMCMSKPHAIRCQAIKMWRRIGGRSVSRNTLIPHIVCHDQNNIWRSGRVTNLHPEKNTNG